MTSHKTFAMLADKLGADPEQVEKVLTGIGLDAPTIERLRLAESDDGIEDFKSMIKAIGNVSV